MKLPEHSDGQTPDHSGLARPADVIAPRRKLLIVGLIFFTAFGVRLLNWQSNRHEVFGVQTSVASNYKHQASLIRANGLASLYDASSSTSNPDCCSLSEHHCDFKPQVQTTLRFYFKNRCA